MKRVGRARQIVGRYELFEELGRGGMGTVVLARLLGNAGFSRIVAVKRAHAGLLADAAARRAALGEARLAARIHHANVVATFDVVEHAREIMAVMEYVRGESLAELLRSANLRNEQIPLPIAAACLIDALSGLAVVHSARDERGAPLGLVHRDLSPQNLLCGADGLVRLSDFGLAKSVNWASSSRNTFVGKLAYAAPEELDGGDVCQASDIYAAGLVLWELLTGQRLHSGKHAGELIARLLHEPPPAPSRLRSDVSPALDAIVARALARDAHQRFGSAAEMAAAVALAVPRAAASELSAWVQHLAAPALARRDAMVARAEAGSRGHARAERPSWGAFALAVCLSGSSKPTPMSSEHVAHALNSLRVHAPVVAAAPSQASRAPEPVAPRARGVARAPKPRLAAHTSPPSPCSPPFSVDSAGIRRMRPGCQ